MIETNFVALDAPVTAIVPLGAGVLVASGDGCVRRSAVGGLGAAEALSDGALLAACASADASFCAVTADDGHVFRIQAGGAATRLYKASRGWVTALDISAETGLIALGIGKAMTVIDDTGAEKASHNVGKTVEALCFDLKGRRIAIGHFGGASVVWATLPAGEKRTVTCPGLPQSLTFSPDGKYLIAGQRDPGLHGWRLDDKRDFQMSGYPRRITSMAWIDKGKRLATAGADLVIAWPFAGKDGPMGRNGEPLGVPTESIVMSLATHPSRPFLAVGFEDGQIVLIALDMPSKPPFEVAPPSNFGPVNHLVWSQDGNLLVAGSETGSVSLSRF